MTSPQTLVKTIEIHNVTVDGRDAQFWRESYVLLRNAITEHLDEFCHEDDVAEEAILCKAIEDVGSAIKQWPVFQQYMASGGPREHGSFVYWLAGLDTPPSGESLKVERLAGPSTHICWTPDHTPAKDRVLVSLVRDRDLRAVEDFISRRSPTGQGPKE